MYNLEFLNIAKKDMDDIIYYVSNNLNNKIAARKLAKEFINGANSILEFPYGVPVYEPIRKLKYEYRRIKIKNFLLFLYNK